MSTFSYQVELKLAATDAHERLARIEDWCGEWEIAFQVIGQIPGTENIRIAFDDRRLARAFISHFGGVLIADDEVSSAMAEDAEYEELYRQYALEYARE